MANLGWKPENNIYLVYPVNGVPLLIPTLKVLTPSTPKSHPWGMTQAKEWKFGSIFYIFYLWAHTKIGIKIFEIDFVIEI